MHPLSGIWALIPLEPSSLSSSGLRASITGLVSQFPLTLLKFLDFQVRSADRYQQGRYQIVRSRQ